MEKRGHDKHWQADEAKRGRKSGNILLQANIVCISLCMETLYGMGQFRLSAFSERAQQWTSP
jgi:hypothetical protein